MQQHHPLLKDTIANFHDYVLDKSEAIAGQIIGRDAESKRVRLNVYHDGYMLRLLEVLGKNYTALKILMGEAHFDRLAGDYVREYPSHHFSIGYAGRYFSQFLSSQPQIEPVWIEVADFEWKMQLIIE